MAYKKLIKVSNVCQLLDKSKYPATKTVNGVTFTNNGDGSFTVNGTAEEEIYYNIQNIGINRLEFGIDIHLNSNHIREIRNNILFEYSGYDKRNGFVFFHIQKGGVCENIVAKPQIFDLTEMYGAGHEPTTVEQFRQDFPDEMYDYSPYCWLTSYKRVIVTGDGNYLTTYQRNLTCKTKNLFDINSANVTIQDDGSFISNISYASHFYSLNVTPGQIYTVSYYTTSLGAVGSGLNLSIQTGDYYRDGEQLFVKLNPKESDTYYKGTFTIPEGATKITFSCMTSNVYRNFMIELGDAATDYVPYGHL